MDDGSVVLVEIAAGALTRVQPDGTTSTVADTGGGPNGAAVGPDGAIYVTNNGGCFDWHDVMGLTFPGSPPPASWPGHGSLQRVDLGHRGGHDPGHRVATVDPLRAPERPRLRRRRRPLVHRPRRPRERAHVGSHRRSTTRRPTAPRSRAGRPPRRARTASASRPTAAGSTWPRPTPAALWGWNVDGPGEVSGRRARWRTEGGRARRRSGRRRALRLAGRRRRRVGVRGHARQTPGITAFAPDGSECEHFPMPDPLTTNICFGGDDGRTAFVTLSGTGQLVAFDWPAPEPRRLSRTACRRLEPAL